MEMAYSRQMFEKSRSCSALRYIITVDLARPYNRTIRAVPCTHRPGTTDTPGRWGSPSASVGWIAVKSVDNRR